MKGEYQVNKLLFAYLEEGAVVSLQGRAHQPGRPTGGDEYEFNRLMVGVDWSSVIFC